MCISSSSRLALGFCMASGVFKPLLESHFLLFYWPKIVVREPSFKDVEKTPSPDGKSHKLLWPICNSSYLVNLDSSPKVISTIITAILQIRKQWHKAVRQGQGHMACKKWLQDANSGQSENLHASSLLSMKSLGLTGLRQQIRSHHCHPCSCNVPDTL